MEPPILVDKMISVGGASLLQDLSLMRYLCSAMLVAAQLAYAVGHGSYGCCSVAAHQRLSAPLFFLAWFFCSYIVHSFMNILGVNLTPST